MVTAVHAFLLPAITVGVGPTAVLLRQVRSELIEVLGHEYVRTARARGLMTRQWSLATRSGMRRYRS
jgi:dipeptide transport system permease protein